MLKGKCTSWLIWHSLTEKQNKQQETHVMKQSRRKKHFFSSSNKVIIIKVFTFKHLKPWVLSFSSKHKLLVTTIMKRPSKKFVLQLINSHLHLCHGTGWNLLIHNTLHSCSTHTYVHNIDMLRHLFGLNHIYTNFSEMLKSRSPKQVSLRNTDLLN